MLPFHSGGRFFRIAELDMRVFESPEHVKSNVIRPSRGVRGMLGVPLG